MTKKEFLKNYEEILKTRKGIKKEQGILGSQKDREKCDFTGVYEIFNNDELVYIGSGYTPQKHNIKKRLAQYVSKEDTGNILLKKVGDKNEDCFMLKNDEPIWSLVKVTNMFLERYYFNFLNGINSHELVKESTTVKSLFIQLSFIYFGTPGAIPKFVREF